MRIERDSNGRFISKKQQTQDGKVTIKKATTKREEIINKAVKSLVKMIEKGVVFDLNCQAAIEVREHNAKCTTPWQFKQLINKGISEASKQKLLTWFSTGHHSDGGTNPYKFVLCEGHEKFLGLPAPEWERLALGYCSAYGKYKLGITSYPTTENGLGSYNPSLAFVGWLNHIKRILAACESTSLVENKD